MAHFVLRTSRYREIVDFYKTLLCAHSNFSNDVLSFLTSDEERHRIAIMNVAGLDDQQAGIAGVHPVAFTYDSLAQLIANYERAKPLGIQPFWCTNHGPTTSFYYRDPDGNQLELQVENFATVEESTEFLYSAEFAENPVGVDFDPEELARRFHAAVPETELKKRPHKIPRGLDTAMKHSPNEVCELEESRWDAMIAADVARLDELLSEKLSWTHSSGHREDKASLLQRISSGQITYRSITRTDERFTKWESVVLVTGIAEMRVEVGGRETIVKNRFTNVWVKELAVWRLAGWQSTPAPAAP
ncbi:hypothetical protein BZM27_16190 [Paraburkholderia steynii]|uniref:VOC domain-containing protein n=1 Tax=Paraburkholderia steynii TaxID=1245441 RepID=A0A4R0XBZ6_9BURK|nr:hypothetical protein BZM27_16190 [Paraburkholderia steynii]